MTLPISRLKRPLIPVQRVSARGTSSGECQQREALDAVIFGDFSDHANFPGAKFDVLSV